MKYILILISTMLMCCTVFAQNRFTKSDIMNMSREDLMDLSFEDLMAAVEVMEVSSIDELFTSIMNKTTTTASKSEESAFTTPLASSTITREEIQQWGCNSIEEALRLIQGVMVSTKTNGNYDVHLRGLNNIVDGQRLLYTENMNTKLMLDGRDITDYVSGSMLMEFIPVGIEDIKCIEIVRGPVSAMYGPQAVTGVINIITDKSSDYSKLTTAGSLQTSLDLGTTVASAITHLPFNDVFSMSVSVNLEKRNRTTNKLFIPLTKANYVTSSYFESWNKYGKGHTIDDYKALDHEWVSVEELNNIGVSDGFDKNGNLIWYPVVMNQMNIKELIPDPELAKKTQSINGGLSFKFSSNNYLDITGGYNKTLVNSSTLDEQAFSLGGRTNQGGYVNAIGHAGNLSYTLNYDHHKNVYSVGVPGYVAVVNRYGAMVDYNISLLDNMAHLRPALEWFLYSANKTYGSHKETINNVEYSISSFFPKRVDAHTISPTLMGDVSSDDGWKAVGSIRLDLTTNPSGQYINYLVGINKQLDNHFFRISYGRATRASVLTNTSVDYLLDRKSVNIPNDIHLVGSDHKLLVLDGVEIGYRVRPTSNILIDSEIFHSVSIDYGSLHSSSSYLTTSGDNFMTWMYGVLDAYSTTGQEGFASFVNDNWKKYYNSHSIFEYENVPFRARQYGASAMIDYIANSHLIFKGNINWQLTRVDKYYQYSQNASIAQQLTNCVNGQPNENGINQSVVGFTTNILQSAIKYATIQCMQNGLSQNSPEFMNYVIDYGMHCATAKPGLIAAWQHISVDELKRLDEAFVNGDETYTFSTGETIDRNDMLGAYYSLLYNIEGDSQEDFKLANSKQPIPVSSNNHKHKSTPSFYGSIGIIYKPSSIVNFSALMSFMSGREFLTSYGSSKVPAMYNLNVKMGWTPNSSVEFFIQGHNLFSNDRKEFVYSDPVKPMLTTGLACKF